MRSPGNSLLNGTVEVDDFFVGGPEQAKTGRGNEKKRLVVMALQVDAFEHGVPDHAVAIIGYDFLTGNLIIADPLTGGARYED